MDIPLHELNKHFFAAIMPETHGEKPAPEVESKKPRKKAPEAAPDAPDAE